jgi:urease accessory protein UreE
MGAPTKGGAVVEVFAPMPESVVVVFDGDDLVPVEVVVVVVVTVPTPDVVVVPTAVVVVVPAVVVVVGDETLQVGDVIVLSSRVTAPV